MDFIKSNPYSTDFLSQQLITDALIRFKSSKIIYLLVFNRFFDQDYHIRHEISRVPLLLLLQLQQFDLFLPPVPYCCWFSPICRFQLNSSAETFQHICVHIPTETSSKSVSTQEHNTFIKFHNDEFNHYLPHEIIFMSLLHEFLRQITSIFQSFPHWSKKGD
ncbi:hypothetical protein TRFO_07112 [Tritrichomonas foetus]|uniref:Uncharacterized protein n=1 Tax=Tritrichomonas foetus TaxID=1144522 RepID=A0A1J4JT55_9EUKA|nr:hypothetical protein TRFO_07112 [Tritrichomonas foetus]|eukprot:OHT02305.1 hypothetical protein TRFO_07112 [Tritrichomonas foetus]